MESTDKMKLLEWYQQAELNYAYGINRQKEIGCMESTGRIKLDVWNQQAE